MVKSTLNSFTVAREYLQNATIAASSAVREPVFAGDDQDPRPGSFIPDAYRTVYVYISRFRSSQVECYLKAQHPGCIIEIFSHNNSTSRISISGNPYLDIRTFAIMHGLNRPINKIGGKSVENENSQQDWADFVTNKLQCPQFSVG
jgi:hypothetical protein